MQYNIFTLKGIIMEQTLQEQDIVPKNFFILIQMKLKSIKNVCRILENRRLKKSFSSQEVELERYLVSPAGFESIAYALCFLYYHLCNGYYISFLIYYTLLFWKIFIARFSFTIDCLSNWLWNISYFSTFCYLFVLSFLFEKLRMLKLKTIT